MYDQRNAPPGSSSQRPMNLPSLPPPPPTTAPNTSQSYSHFSHSYPTLQHNYQPRNLYPNLQEFPSPSASSSFHQPHLPPTGVYSHPPVTSLGQASYGPSHSTSNFPVPFSSGNFGPSVVVKSEGENLVSGSIPFSGRVVGQVGGSTSRMIPSAGDCVSSAGSSKADQSLPLLNPIEVGYHSFADSDTEMEDDITHPDDDPGVKYSTEAPNSSPNLVSEKIDEKESLAEQPSSRRDSQLPIPAHCFPSSSDSAKAQDVSEFGGTDMYDPFVDSLEPHPNSFKNLTHDQQHEPASDLFVDSLKPHPNLSHVQQHEPATDPFVDSLKPHHPNLTHVQQDEPASDPFVDSLKPHHPNLTQVQQDEPASDSFVDSFEPHLQQDEPAIDPFVDSLIPHHPNLTHVQQPEPAIDHFVDSLKPHHQNLAHIQQHEPASGFNVTSGLGALSNKRRDIEESDRGSDFGTVVPETSTYNKEFGENGKVETETGSIETGSSDPPDEPADVNTNTNEVDSGRKRSREKKTNKDSRSMRLFKVVLTQFVKDCLKPSWRQGNMSKEAFKTIVKKTVDKVSSAMEGRRIPKSRAKIDRYIDSSQHKLTKLVMGYVDKYVKA